MKKSSGSRFFKIYLPTFIIMYVLILLAQLVTGVSVTFLKSLIQLVVIMAVVALFNYFEKRHRTDQEEKLK